MAGRGFRVRFDCPELRNVLRNIDQYNTRTAVKIENAVRTSSKTIARGARRRVPVRSGYLKNHMGSRFNVRTITGVVYARAPHAHLVEWGHEVTDQYGSYIGEAAERPFMRPAYEDEKPNLVRNIIAAVQP